MRYSIAYYLLLIYLVAMLRPVFPLVSDAVAHTFTESSHLSTIHMVYGTDHADKEISAAGAEEKKNKQTSEKAIDLLSVHLMKSSIQYTFLLPQSLPSYSLSLQHKLPVWYSLLHTPPPDLIG